VNQIETAEFRILIFLRFIKRIIDLKLIVRSVTAMSPTLTQRNDVQSISPLFNNLVTSKLDKDLEIKQERRSPFLPISSPIHHEIKKKSNRRRMR